MTIKYQAKTPLEKFGKKVFSGLVENFPRTFYVGGMVRDLLLNKQIMDIDIATQATPDQVKSILAGRRILFEKKYENFGVIVAKQGRYIIEIATFRKDSYNGSRYPKVKFAASPEIDSQRRDFTINALYFSPTSGKILDFHNGISDLKSRLIRFIGKPEKRLEEDPLRIIRALRFALNLNFKIETATDSAIEKNIFLISKISPARLQTELDKIFNKHNKKILEMLFKK